MSLIRALFDAQGWSQARLAKAAGVSRPTVAKALHSDGTLSIDTVQRLARAMSVPDYRKLLPPPGGKP